jgi:hypothetical protein
MSRLGWSRLVGILSIVCFVFGALAMKDSTGRTPQPLSDIPLYSSFPLCLVAGILGRKRWWWLLPVYLVLGVWDILSHMLIGF